MRSLVFIAFVFSLVICANWDAASGDEPALSDRPTVHHVHPLDKPLKLASEIRDHIRTTVQDYSCVLVKRERVNGRLRDHEYIYAKVRHDVSPEHPFGVYLRYLAPGRVKGREVLFVDGRNNGQLVARNGGKRFSFVVTSLDPQGPSAMQGNRYPITEIGILRLTERLIEVAETTISDPTQAEVCQVQIYPSARIDGRECRCIEVKNVERREGQRFHVARIFIDKDLRVPRRYEAYDWPRSDDSGPILLEEYTYTKLKLNEGFSELDFDRGNVAYKLGG